MSNHSIIEHRANYHYIKIEEDYVRICSFGKQYPQCKAAILGVLEHWINDKQSKGQSLYVYMTYPEWIEAMYGLFRRNTIIACLAELVQDKLVFRRPCTRYGKETFEYSLNIKLVQERLKELAEREEKNTRPNLNASKFKRQAIQKQTRPNLNGTSRPNLNDDASKNKRNIDTTQIPSHIDSEGTYGADAPTPAHLKEIVDEKLEEVEELRRITGEHPTVKPTDTESHYHIAGGAIGNDDPESEDFDTDAHERAVINAFLEGDTDKRQAVTIGATQRLTSPQAPGALTGVQAQPLSAPTPAQAEFPPAGSTEPAPTAQASGFKPPKRPRGKQPLVTLTLMGSQVMGWIAEIRGAKPRMTQSNVRACNALADTDGVSLEALTAYYALVDAQKWEVDLLTAAGETGNDKVGFLSFESNWPKLKRKLKGQAQGPPQDWVPAENDYSTKAQLWRQEHPMARSGK